MDISQEWNKRVMDEIRRNFKKRDEIRTISQRIQELKDTSVQLEIRTKFGFDREIASFLDNETMKEIRKIMLENLESQNNKLKDELNALLTGGLDESDYLQCVKECEIANKKAKGEIE